MMKKTKLLRSLKGIFDHPLFSGSVIMVGGSTAINGVNYFYHLIMGRLLEPSGYGALASLFSILYIASIVPQSASFAIVKFVSSVETKEEIWGIYKKVRSLTLYLAATISVLILIFSPLIQNFLHIDDIISVIFISPTVFFFLLTITNQATLQGVLNFRAVVGTNFIQNATKLVLGIAAVLIGLRVAGAMAAVLIGSFVSYLVSRSLVIPLKTVRAKENFSFLYFFKYALPLLLQAFAFTSFFTTDLILVKHYLSSVDAGLYAALSMLGKIIYFAAQPITQVMFPIVSQKRSKGERYRKVFYLSFLITMTISLGIVLVYYLFSDIAIRILYGSSYLSAKNQLVWMGLFMAIYTGCYLLANFLMSIGRTKAVVFPIIVAFVQALGIMLWHKDVLQTIKVSLLSMLILLLLLITYLVYNEVRKLYEKE